jgi:AmmeMemoRadiSam system protein A
MIALEQRRFLLNLARSAITSQLYGNGQLPECPDDALFRREVGAFVTLHRQGALRGCIGYVRGVKPLYETIIDMARAAAFDDYRFGAVQGDEVDELEIEISVLSEMLPVTDVSEIVVGRDGLLITNGMRSGLLLPQVAVEWNWDVITFLQETCRKAGLHRDCWNSHNCRILRFSAEIFSEERKKSV